MSGQSNQDRATCLKEAGAALEESKKHAFAASDGELAENRQKRCEALPSPDREDCSARMNDGATNLRRWAPAGAATNAASSYATSRDACGSAQTRTLQARILRPVDFVSRPGPRLGRPQDHWKKS